VSPQSIAAAASAIARGEVVAFPTESSYGLAVLLEPTALARLFSLKQREPGKPPPILIAPDMLERLVTRVPERARTLMARFWPGPLTLVLPARTELPELVVADGYVGVRQSPHPIAAALVRAVGAPITATSANRSGEPPAMTADEARRAFPTVHVLDAGTAGAGLPSTVVRVDDDGVMTMLREGAIAANSLPI
jgi:L-threonylcarbamoyladenylate synthase